MTEFREDLENLLIDLKKSASKPEGFVSLIRGHQLRDKHQHAADEQRRAVIAKALAIIKTVEAAPNANQLLAALKKASGSKSNDLIAVVQETLFDLKGPEKRQYKSRDRTAILRLRTKNVPPAEASEFIKKDGGLVACAAKHRKELRGESIPDPDWPKATKSSSRKKSNDFEVRLVRLRPKGRGTVEILKSKSLAECRDEDDLDIIMDLVRLGIRSVALRRRRMNRR